MPERPDPDTTGAPHPPTFREALRWWLKLGCISFGGPAGQIAVMHRELVERRRWISGDHFLHALNFCMLLPGPEAQQLATYLGWRLHGARGGIAAGALFVLPSALLLFALSWLFMEGRDLPWLRALFAGLAPAVVAIVVGAVHRIGRKALRSPSLWSIAIASFALIRFTDLSFLVILLAAALTGWFGHRHFPRQFPAGGGHDHSAAAAAPTVRLPPPPAATWRRTLTVLAVTLVLWWLPSFACGALLGWNSTPVSQGLFFSKAALVTFGGAYAVLPYVAHHAVETSRWLGHSDMMAGLALAESTPGPLIMVLQFVGFAGGWNHPGSLTPLAAATLGALVTTWATFLPGFLMVFLGAPHIESLQRRPRLTAALTAITAAVVGVILDLALTFAGATLFHSTPVRFDLFALAIAIAAFITLERTRVPMPLVIAAAALAGLARSGILLSV